MTEKLQKILANQGFGSRREMEQWIIDGRITVNGQIAKLGDRATLEDDIRVDSKPIATERQKPKRHVILYHKPAGEICTRNDPEGRPTVFQSLPPLKQGRWIGIGRLDLNTSGLLLFTNDGELANRLMHPKSEVEREYAVRIFGKVEDRILEQLLAGVHLEDGPARFNEIIDAGGEGINHWYHVVVSEGRNRMVRRLWESQGLQVSRLIRVRFGDIVLPRHLRPGEWEQVRGEDLHRLFETR